MFAKGKRRAGPDNERLRQLRREDRSYIRWCHRRFAEMGSQLRAARVRADIAEGRLEATQQLVQRQVAQLMERDSAIDRMQRQMKADAVRTQEIPVVTEERLRGVAA